LPGPALRQAILPDPDPTNYPQNNHLQETVLKPIKKAPGNVMLFLVLAKVKLVIPLYRLRNILTIAVLPWSSWFMLNHMARGLPTHWFPD